MTPAHWPSKKYKLLYSDPPWSFTAWSNKAQRHVTEHYSTMTMDDIYSLPVESIAEDNSVLFLWVTMPNLPQGLETIRRWGFCVSPDTRVLTRDLRWRPAEEIRVGDRLLGFDDKHVPHSIGDKGRRYFRNSDVLSTGIEYLDSYEVRLADGTNLRCSADHPWLVKGSVTLASGECSSDKTNWIRSSEMANTLKHPRRKRPLEMIRVTPLATPRNDYRSGFLSAAFDAEGSLNLQKAPVLSFAQNENPLLLQVEDYLQAIGYPIHRYVATNVPHVNLRGGMDISFRFLMEMRPPRLLDKWARAPIDHISIYNREKVPVDEVRHIGKQAMVTLMTSSGTYVAEGFGAHNTFKTCAFTWIKTNKKSGGLFTGLGYYTRCLGGAVNVYVQDRTTARVECIKLGELAQRDIARLQIWSHTGWKDITAFYANPIQPTALISTRFSNTISTWNHRWARKRLSTPRKVDDWEHRRREHVVEYEELSRISDRKQSASSVSGSGSINLIWSTTPIESSKPIVDVGGFPLTEDMGWMVGLFCAEGNYGCRLGTELRWNIHSDEIDIADRLGSIIDSLQLRRDRYFNMPLKLHRHKPKSSKGLALYFSSKRISDFTRAFIHGEGAHEKRLDMDLLLQTPAVFRRGLLNGMLDGDATKTRCHEGYMGKSHIRLCNEELIDDLGELAMSIGVMINRDKTSTAAASNGTLSTSYGLRFPSPRNKSLILDGVQVLPVEIKAIEPWIALPTYDLGVDGHSFVADGMISHNSNSELCLLATRGKPLPRLSHSVHSVVMSPVQEHSRKPAIVRDRIVELFGDLPRLEMFARQRVSGWDSWGFGVENVERTLFNDECANSVQEDICGKLD